MKHFDGNHHGYHSLESAHRAMIKIGNHINEVKKLKENRERARDLQSNTIGWAEKNVSVAFLSTFEDEECLLVLSNLCVCVCMCVCVRGIFNVML